MTDFLKEIEKAESTADSIVEKAKQEAFDIVKKAEAEAADIIQETGTKANTNKKAMIRNAETDAVSKRDAQSLELDKELEQMRSKAMNNMDKAVEVIVKKVGSN